MAGATQTAPRDSLNGCWILDKTKEPWSMNKYLECMNVDPLAIEAHDKGDAQFDTYHTIDMDLVTMKLVKRSRVNNDLVLELQLGKEHVEYLPPGDRPKRSLAQSDHPGHLCIQSSLQTVHGKASVKDVKQLVTIQDEGDGQQYMKQELTVVNEQTGKTHTTVRHFKPYLETPPHLVVEEAAVAAAPPTEGMVDVDA